MRNKSRFTDKKAACPGVVSCADILALAARDGTVLLGGPTLNLANVELPPPSANVSGLIVVFGRKGLTLREMAVHTVGFAQCRNFQDRVYKEANCPTLITAAAKCKLVNH
ncbi:peroxidase 2-like [Aegilops tauschii subsp. strangulata]|uniref:peroxidase 2-like n=1 Tax=Aegilops tauschii subsp. strangulata TaxID=200361 RepID=UPI003CC84E22